LKIHISLLILFIEENDYLTLFLLWNAIICRETTQICTPWRLISLKLGFCNAWTCVLVDSAYENIFAFAEREM